MFSLASTALLALAVASCSAHSIHHVRRHHARATPPKGWATGYLEDYDVYHSRYLAIGCENKHNTSFFDFCCHPMLSTETLAKNRPACCAPGSTAQCPSTPSSAAAPASTDADNEDCDDEDVDDGNNDQGEDDEDCEDDDGTEPDDDTDDEDCEDEDDGDETTSATHVAAATSTHTSATSTHAAPTSTPTHAVSSDTPAARSTTHTTTKATTAPTTTSTADTSTKTSTSSSNQFITGGFGTWFTQNGVAGACGTVHKDTDFVVALPTKAYANGANCGRKVKVFNLVNGKTVEGTIADACPSCTNNECLDMSVAMFESLDALSVGEFSIKYQFLD